MKICLKPQPILIPNKKIDHAKWSVVSCDQFTSQREYWETLKNFVGDAKSTLKLIFPEVYLEDGRDEEIVSDINQTMTSYLQDDVFDTVQNKYILVVRTTKFGQKRLGLMASVDLEEFVYDGSKKSQIRSTEGVVPERIPARLKVRKDAPIELPHIILLIDDREKMLIENLYQQKEKFEKIYDFELNMDGGHLEGYLVDTVEVERLFERLYDAKLQKEKYGEATNFVLAVGDGNHSLATAKAHWENIKKDLNEEERESHPARFALCEIENLHCDGIVFEPIHRCVFGVKEDFVEFLKNSLTGDSKVQIVYNENRIEIAVPTSTPMAIAEIQKAIENYKTQNAGVKVDYIHGTEHLLKVAKENGGVAIFMPAIKKADLFDYVLKNGALCKKSFSMGEAEEKRYYFEAKNIKK